MARAIRGPAVKSSRSQGDTDMQEIQATVVGKPDLIAELNAIENLPTLPIVAQQIMKLVASSNSNMAQIAAVVSRDQAIAARVIRLVNSAFYGLQSRVGSVQHAIVVLGLNVVKNLVVGVSVVKLFEDSAQASIFDRQQFWVHTFACARAARLLAERTGRSEPEDYFVAGLLHDIGILVLDQYFHPRFVDVLGLSIRERIEYNEAERRVLGLNHGEVGGVLAQKWRVPDFVTRTVRYHHNPERMPADASADRDIVAMVHFADARVQEARIGSFIETYRTACDPAVERYLNLSGSLVGEVVLQVGTEVKDLMKEWGL
jgi:putative nucleotidyltransferase with HDIG domain